MLQVNFLKQHTAAVKERLAIKNFKNRGGPVGLETVAATMNEDAGTIEDVVEPYLLQIGFLARTRRGRALTKDGCEHVGVPFRGEPAVTELFGDGAV